MKNIHEYDLSLLMGTQYKALCPPGLAATEPVELLTEQLIMYHYSGTGWLSAETPDNHLNLEET